MSGKNVKRRRGSDNITQNACTECRKKRSKGGITAVIQIHTMPRLIVISAMARNHAKDSKEQLRGEVEQLKLKEKQQEMLIIALLSNDFSESQLEQLRIGDRVKLILEGSETLILDLEVPRNNSDTFQIEIAYDTSLVKGKVSLVTTPVINDKNKNESNINIQKHSEESNYQPSSGNSLTILRPLDEFSRTSVDLSREYETFSNRDIFASESTYSMDQLKYEGLDLKFPIKATDWTTVSSDKTWINHLIMLYFCWEYPIFAPLSKDHFLEDFKNGNRRYCSSLLVNSILAAGCRFSSQPKARSDPTDPKTAGDQFFSEAIKILQSGEDLFCLTKVQALNVLSIREAACGHSSVSIFYSGQAVRLAIEMGLHKDLNITIRKNSELKKHTVRLATFWGAFALDQAWSLCCGKLPQFSENIKFVKKPRMVDKQGSPGWCQFSEDVKSELVSSQASSDWNVFVIFCDLSNIIHRSLHILYSQREKITSFKLLACYTEFLHWYDSNPTKMRLGQVFTPAILFSHIFYHFTILLIFRPLINVNITNSTVSPRKVCLEASDAISSLVKSYNELYTLHHAPALVPYIVLISNITKITIYRNSGIHILTFKEGIDSLQLMTSSNATAFFGLDILHYLTEHDGVLNGLDLNEEGFEQNMEIQENMLCEKVILRTTDKLESATLNRFSPETTYLDSVTVAVPEFAGDQLLLLPTSSPNKPLSDPRDRLNDESIFQVHNPESSGFSMMK